MSPYWSQLSYLIKQTCSIFSQVAGQEQNEMLTAEPMKEKQNNLLVSKSHFLFITKQRPLPFGLFSIFLSYGPFLISTICSFSPLSARHFFSPCFCFLLLDITVKIIFACLISRISLLHLCGTKNKTKQNSGSSKLFN